MCINYALLGFCLCHFRRHKGIKRFNSVCIKQIKYLKKNCLIYDNVKSNKNSRRNKIRCA